MIANVVGKHYASALLARLRLSSVVREDGQALVEYALIIALVALAVVAALGFLGTNLTTEFSSIANNL